MLIVYGYSHMVAGCGIAQSPLQNKNYKIKCENNKAVKNVINFSGNSGSFSLRKFVYNSNAFAGQAGCLLYTSRCV